MNAELLKKVQNIQLEIAKEIKRVCDENKIEYWLMAGSLLGAIRHKGFIPWDDDLDIGMRREEFEKFIKIAPEKLDKNYYLQQWKTDENYGLPFAKIRKNGTLYIEDKSKKSKAHNGIYVDIIPFDNFGNNYLKQGIPLMFLKGVIMYKSGIRNWNETNGINFIRFIKNIPSIIVSPFCKRKFLIKKYDQFATKYNTQKMPYMFAQGSSRYGKYITPATAMKDTIETSFEGVMFKIPTGYHEYLTHTYGNYMELPPENERENRHQILEVKF